MTFLFKQFSMKSVIHKGMHKTTPKFRPKVNKYAIISNPEIGARIAVNIDITIQP